MIEVNFRIIVNLTDIKHWNAEKFDREGDLEGFFQINFNNYIYGYYHSGPLGTDEEGGELLTEWFERLIRAIILLNNNDYVAISDIESYNIWIEFVKMKKNLVVSLAECEDKVGLSDIITLKLARVRYPEWKNVVITIEELKEELIKKTELYIEQVQSLNEQFMNSNRMKSLNELLNQIK